MVSTAPARLRKPDARLGVAACIMLLSFDPNMGIAPRTGLNS
jgi:hypothetical protein